jgi:hypothetical protein
MKPVSGYDLKKLFACPPYITSWSINRREYAGLLEKIKEDNT